MNNMEHDNSNYITDKVILIVDDDEIIRESFSAFLEDSGYSVLEAEDGRKGLELFQTKSPDLVIVDLNIPEIMGLDLLSQIKELSPDTAIIIISGTGVIEDAIGALRLGAWDYLLKPVENLSVLLHSIRRNIERSLLIRENRRYKEHLEQLVRDRTSELEKTNQELERTRLQIIRRLGKVAEFRDNESGRHVIRVSLYATILAEGLGLDVKLTELIYHCSPMHDIGKIGIPDRILMKHGELDPEEWDLMKRHSKIGSQILENFSDRDLSEYRKHTILGKQMLSDTDSELMDVARKIALYHHEHWDGSGYPEGLKGDEIPIEARIVSVADIYDILSNDRIYRKAYPEELCQKMIREMSGSYLDPNIVVVFFKSIDQILRVKENWKD